MNIPGAIDCDFYELNFFLMEERRTIPASL